MRWRKRLLRTGLLICITPLLLTLCYRDLPAPSTLMLYDIATLHWPQRDWIAINDVSPHAINAVLSAEDSAFCQHLGFDFRQLSKSLERALDEDRPLRGTSSISQQTAKNLFLWHGRSWFRKALEAPLTIWLELTLSKQRILEIYLNVAEWGDGLYGIEAASQQFFNISAKHLSSYQASLLATALPNPRKRNPARPGPTHRAMAINIQKRMINSSPDLSCLQ